QNPSAASLDDLWRRSAPTAGVMQCRDSTWTRWRFAATGHDEYRFLSYYTSGGCLAGYVVVRLRNIRGLLVSFVVDGLWSPEDGANTAVRLMKAACAWACAEHAALVIAYASRIDDWSKALSRASFRRLPEVLSLRPYRVCARIHSTADESLGGNSAAW